MHYEIEVNVGRKNANAVWSPMISNEDESVCQWTDREEAISFIQSDTRSLRLIRVEETRRVIVLTFLRP